MGSVALNVKRDHYMWISLHDVPKDLEIVITRDAEGIRRIKIGTIDILFFDEEEPSINEFHPMIQEDEDD